jgi:Ca2+-binding RTX toxin-like protein
LFFKNSLKIRITLSIVTTLFILSSSNFIQESAYAITVEGRVTILQITFCGKTIDKFDNVIDGTEGRDKLEGTALNDLIRGFSGDDAIEGSSGNDCLLGGAGNDKITGGAGNDMIDGGAGNDKIIGGAGNDVIDGKTGFDSCNGSSGTNIIINCEAKLSED